MPGGSGSRGHSEEVQLAAPPASPASPGGPVLDAVGRYRRTRDNGEQSGRATFGGKGRKTNN
jgi:hypothetical protein